MLAGSLKRQLDWRMTHSKVLPHTHDDKILSLPPCLFNRFFPFVACVGNECCTGGPRRYMVYFDTGTAVSCRNPEVDPIIKTVFSRFIMLILRRDS